MFHNFPFLNTNIKEIVQYFFILFCVIYLYKLFVLLKAKHSRVTIGFYYPEDPWDWYIHLHLVDFYGKLSGVSEPPPNA